MQGQGSGAGTLAAPVESLSFGGLSSGAGAGPNAAALLPVTPDTSGTYQLSVGGTGTGSYTLVSAASDDYSSLPSAATPLVIGAAISGGLQTDTDVDTFAVSLVAGYTYRFDALGAGSGLGTAPFPGIALENVGLGDVANSSIVSPGDGRVSYTPSLSGSYLVAVNGAGVGSYTLVSAPAVHTTNYLSGGGIQAGALTTSTPTNVYSVALLAGVSYQFDLRGTGASPLSAPSLLLSAPDSSTAAVSANAGPNDARVTFTAPTSGTYALTASGAGAGGYSLASRPGSTVAAVNPGALLIQGWASYQLAAVPGGPAIYTGTQLPLPGPGTANQAAVASAGGFAYNTNGGSGAIWTEPQVTGVAPSIPGNGITLDGPGSNVVSGNRADTIVAATGANFIATGTGSAATIRLQGGSNYVASEGRDTITASAGPTTVEVSGAAVIGTNSRMLVISDSGTPTVNGGTGSVTVYGGFGGGLFIGGSAGNNLLVAGTSASTIMGGGSGDVLLASGGSGTVLIAGIGNETLSGQFSSGANSFTLQGADFAVGGRGGNQFLLGGNSQASIVGGMGAANTFTVIPGTKTAFIANFRPGTDTVFLANQFGSDGSVTQFNDPGPALAGARTVAGSEVVTFGDGTTIAFLNVTGLQASSFVTLAAQIP